MPLTDAGLGQFAKKVQSVADGLSLHSDVPGRLALHELSGGSYLRRGAPISLSGTNQAILSSPQSFSVPAGWVKYIGLWGSKNSADPANDFLGYWPIDNVHYDAPGVYTVSAGTFTITSTDS